METHDTAPDGHYELTASIAGSFEQASQNVFEITHHEFITRERGYYGVLYAKPSRVVRSILSLDREILILISTFTDQQPRTIQTAREIVLTSGGRLETSTFVVVHRDNRGNVKLKAWGREQSLVVLPIYVPTPEYLIGRDILRHLAHELFSHDPFDITGPVADDLNFYGRREEAIHLARKLQSAQIRSCFGVRKIGKTSIIHRFIREIKENFESKVLLIDCSEDSVFSLTAAELIDSIASSIIHLDRVEDQVVTLKPDRGTKDVAAASGNLASAIGVVRVGLILVFDEVDYITPGSPTAEHWRNEFNIFWRNLRVIYQRMMITGKSLSIFISGVSSKWFAIEAINGVENAALSFVPEEYLSPLPRGAAEAMIRRLGKTAGLLFSIEAAWAIGDACSNMPFWIRKACSYIHVRIEIGLRPYEPQVDVVREYLREFIASDGSTMAAVALSHLFRIYPEMKPPILACARGDGTKVTQHQLRILEKYGIIRSAHDPQLSGLMLSSGIRVLEENEDVVIYEQNSGPAALDGGQTHVRSDDLGEWAEELATIGRRRNLVERKLRGICANFIRYSSLISKDQTSSKGRVLIAVDAKRRSSLQHFELDELVTKLYWLELVSVVKREWALFERIFGDRTLFDQNAEIVNDRPDAHAKDMDVLDRALHRRALEWFEERLSKV